MNLNQLQYVLSVAEHRSFSLAAENLFISQSTLSQQIMNLERIVELCSNYEYQFWDMAWNEGYEFKADLK